MTATSYNMFWKHSVNNIKKNVITIIIIIIKCVMVGGVWLWESALNFSRTRTSNEDLQQVLETHLSIHESVFWSATIASKTISFFCDSQNLINKLVQDSVLGGVFAKFVTNMLGLCIKKKQQQQNEDQALVLYL